MQAKHLRHRIFGVKGYQQRAVIRQAWQLPSLVEFS